MRIVFSLGILLLLILKNSGVNLYYSLDKNTSTNFKDSPPEFYALEWKEGVKLFPQQTNLYIEIDSIGRQEILMLVDQYQAPILYTSEIATPVCADGECKLMHIQFYWTLLGEYAGFDRNVALPLTKYDHDEFQQSDYQKLHELLLDDKSVIGRRSIDQLVDKPKMRNVNGVDAISGATVARVKEAVVSGALYSCYTAWHLVYGNIQEKLKTRTLSMLNEQMIINMLYSSNQEYHIFALEKIETIKYKEHYKQIAEIFKTSTPLVRSIIAKRITTTYIETPDLQKPFWEAFDTVDSGSRSILMNYLHDAPSYVKVVLSSKLSVMSKNQLSVFLDFLTKEESVDAEIRNEISVFANSEDETYSYLAQEYLEDTP
ncbi:hypothetical protein GH721_06280 [Kriegella sp. EG-1]|nr:hypothetical protein [Flavobacteriaceae bacterium EG-1]